MPNAPPVGCEPVVLVIGLPGLETSGDCLRRVLQLCDSLSHREALTILLVGLPKAKIDSLIDGDEMAALAVLAAQSNPVQLEPGKLWAIADDVTPELAGTELQFEPANSEDRFPVDHVMKLVASQQEVHAIGLLIHGKSTDGILGLRSISDSGGLTLIEAPKSSDKGEQDNGNRRNQLAGGDIDHYVKFSQLSPLISSYVNNYLAKKLDPADDTRRSIIESIGEITEILHRETNHQFKNYKTSTLVRRIERRIKVTKANSVAVYLELLRDQEAERTALFRDLLISVTSFFRDPQYLERLKATALKRLVQEQDQIRIWVAGCASGEEAFSLAILCDELREELARKCEVQILATDIDTRALAVARSGTYPLGIEAHVGPERLQKYFVKKAGKYHVVQSIREMCLFSVHNLISDLPFSKLHLITCRNVLIYLGSHLQMKLMPLFHFALNPGGFLFLGPSESLSGNRELFVEIDSKHRIWQRALTAVDGHGKSIATGMAKGNLQQRSTANKADLKLVAQRILLGEFSPEWAIIDENCRVVSASEEIEIFLRIGTERFENHVVSLAKTGLKAGLRVTINESLKKQRRVDHDKLSMRVKGGIQRVRLTVQPMPRMGREDTLLMLVFRKEGAVLSREEYANSTSLNADNAIIEQLESDLARTREDLENSYHDLELANEELKSSNEELLSTNEELQTANVELESSREELSTLNSQLLSAKNDLENLLQSSDMAMILVDRSMNVKGFTDAARKIYNLIDADVGRPLWHLTHNAIEMPEFPSLEELFEQAEHSELITTKSSRVYRRRVLPYTDRNSGNLLGMVISFSDETRSIRSEYRARFAVEAGGMGVWIWNMRENLIELDEFAYQLLHADDDHFDVFNSTLDTLTALANLSSESCRELEQLVENAYSKEEEFSIDCQLVLPGGQVRWLTFSGGADPVESQSMTGIVYDTTERKLFFNRLSESEMFNRAIVENSPDCVKIIDCMGNLESMSTNGCRLMEVDDFEKIRGIRWWELWPAKQSDLIKTAVEAGARGEHVHFQAECPTARGRPRWWDVVVTGIPNAAGSIDRLLAVSRDISSSKQNENLTIEFAEKLQAAMEVAELGIAAVDYLNDTVTCDSVAARIMSLPAGTAISRTDFHNRFESSDRQRILDAADRALKAESERGFFAEARVPGENGWTWVNLRKRNFIDDSGNAIRGLLAIQDITELRRTEFELREQHLRLHQILTAAQAGTWDWKIEDGHVNWSPESYRLFGMPDSIDHLTLDLCMSRIVTEDRDRVRNSLNEAFEKGELQWRCEFRVSVTENVVRWLFSSGTVEYDRDGKPVRMAGINIDISPQKLLEQELIAARNTAERATRVRGEFLANMSHEIRTPMTAILGHAEILAGQVKEADDLVSLEAIRSNGKHLLDLINDILDLSKIDAGKLEIVEELVNPEVLLADIRSLMDVRAAEKNLLLEFQFETEIPESIITDELRLRQVLINLLGNAIKFTETGTVKVKIRFNEKDSVLYFRIEDTGIGIPTELMPTLFDAFTQADSSNARRFEGTGLGLAISRRLVNALGGEILAESQPGFGSAFTVVLPCKSADTQRVLPDFHAHPTVQSLPVEVNTIDAVILIVDDRRDIRLIAQHMVEKAGGRVLTAENGQQAVDMLTGNGNAQVDLVLMDMQMPTLDGYAATRQLRQRGFTKPIIALTANAMKEDRDRCLEAGCDDYTSKPLDHRRLVELIAQLLRRHT